MIFKRTEFVFLLKKAKLNELEPNEGDQIETPDVVLTVQISHSLNSKLRVNFSNSSKIQFQINVYYLMSIVF